MLKLKDAQPLHSFPTGTIEIADLFYQYHLHLLHKGVDYSAHKRYRERIKHVIPFMMARCPTLFQDEIDATTDQSKKNLLLQKRADTVSLMQRERPAIGGPGFRAWDAAFEEAGKDLACATRSELNNLLQVKKS